MLDVYVLSLSILDITTVFEMVYDFYVGCMVYSLGFRNLRFIPRATLYQ